MRAFCPKITRHKAEKPPPCGGSEGSFKIKNEGRGGIMRETGFAQSVVLSASRIMPFKAKPRGLWWWF
jgi:hypothetical protein